MGFDVGIKVFSTNDHLLKIGRAITRLLGEIDLNFAEVYVVYSIPFFIGLPWVRAGGPARIGRPPL